jgi:chemotaxis protein methyltransferase CheR
MKLEAGEYEQVVGLMSDLCGIALSPEKTYLVETRLGPVCERHGLSDFAAMCRALRSSPQGALARDAVDAITTHETSFFRDANAFDALQFKALPEVLDARQKGARARKLRIWCAACSTGQEPYSIGILVADMLGEQLRDWDVEILASDISEASVQKARVGVYSDLEIGRCTRPDDLRRHVARIDDGWRIDNRVRALVRFETRNLMDPFRGLGPFDIVFCRNVSIYFGRDVRADLFRRIRDVITAPDGCLFVGGSENIRELDESFQPLQHCRAQFYKPHAAR